MGDFEETVKIIRGAAEGVKKLRPTRYDTFSITESGKEEVEEGYSDDGIEGAILNYLYERSGRTVREIASGVQSQEKQVKPYIERLLAKRRIMKG